MMRSMDNMNHVHKWREIRNATGEYQKGTRGYFRTKGTAIVCDCGDGEFVPANKSLTRVLIENQNTGGS